MTPIPGAYLVTLRDPALYTDTQLDLACTVAHHMHRGRFVLTVEPLRHHRP